MRTSFEGALTSRFRQRGIMNLLLVLMIGLAMTVTSIGVVHVVRSSQEGQLSLHSMTPAQQSAWTGAELVRRYLVAASASTIANLSGPLAVSGLSGLTVNIVSVSSATSGSTVVYRVVANIASSAATSTSAASTATLQVVYNVIPNPSGGTPGGSGSAAPSVNISTINIYKNLDMTGGITVLGGNNANLNVQGNVTLDNASITGVNSINATGNVSIGSGIHVNQVYSNGNVTVTGSASVNQISALGNVEVDGGANPFVITANGTVTFDGGSATSVTAIGDVNVNAGGVVIGSITTEGNVNWTGSGGSATTIKANGTVTYAGSNTGSTSITSQGDVNLTGAGAQNVTTSGNVTMGGFASVAALQAQGNLTLNSWSGVTGTIGGTLNKSSSYMPANIQVTPGYTVSVPTIALSPLQQVTVSQPAIDAYALQSSANYVFTMVNGAVQVTVSNVAGIQAGTYYLGSYPFANGRGYQDFLCTQLITGTLNSNGVGQCGTPATPSQTLCQGQSTENDCLSYSNGAWTISGLSFARGVLWFQGDLNLSNGYYLDTAIATGNITTSGSFRIDSPNYAGYAEMCTNSTPSGMTLAPVQVADFSSIYPAEFCNLSNQSLIANPIGNVALLAGGYVNGVFSGGNITVGASSVINGSVLAGNDLNTGGSTTINGYITSAAENTSDTSPVTLSGATLLNFSQLPSTYSPGIVPCMQNCAATSQNGSANNNSTIQWTRYL
ncbi:beta strand repeat-containing protein [Dyella caseinilytica]|uniref:Uncharacterized protein n=1 Tax=Dyella caseinilytica TaxID=1849581 RepID=A0ABX7GYP9_9GAMM|nr:hypothetical protein [Dyella caseinilytica]QRN55628.1 hypothetical protein ISN74_10050 [Dyella caseinilytica]GGA03224.1 hypothetical protein GCM10011408_25910 [Dyella caseinilytica]